MKSLTEHIQDNMICELSSKFLIKAAHAAVDKGDLRQVRVFMNGAKKRKKEEDKKYNEEYISRNAFWRVALELRDIYIKYGNKMFKRGWNEYLKSWIFLSGGSNYEGTDWRNSAMIGIDEDKYILTSYDDKKMKETTILKPKMTRGKYRELKKECYDEMMKVIKEFFKKYPDPYHNFITKYETNEEASKHTDETWKDLDGDRTKYAVGLGVNTGSSHPYASGSGRIFGYNAVMVEDSQHHTDKGLGGGLGMPAVTITGGHQTTYATLLDKDSYK